MATKSSERCGYWRGGMIDHDTPGTARRVRRSRAMSAPDEACSTRDFFIDKLVIKNSHKRWHKMHKK